MMTKAGNPGLQQTLSLPTLPYLTVLPSALCQRALPHDLTMTFIFFIALISISSPVFISVFP